MQETIAPPRWQDSLSVRLLAITIAIILLVELIIFVPSAVGFRDNWIDDRLQAASVAALALEAAPSKTVSDELSAELLENAGVLSVASIEPDKSRLVISPSQPITGDTVVINRTNEPHHMRLLHTISLFFHGGDRVIVASFVDTMNNDDESDDITIEARILEEPLCVDIIDFSGRILGLSLIISIVAGLLVYLVLDFLVVRPMRRVTASIMQFRNDPSATTTEPALARGKDEISLAQNALADMEAVVSDAFRQRARLAQLGEAVAKINHDLRNSLSAAQLVSDGLARSDDPRVQRAAPRLERALERAIKLAQNTLQYGKTEAPKPTFQTADLHQIIEEASAEALSGFPKINWQNNIPAGTMHRVDPDHLHRIISNLARNAAAATTKARPDDGLISISLEDNRLTLQDNGPGLPRKTQANLFVPFAGSTTRGGSGLGLAIARELSQVMGGDLTLADTGEGGTTFRIDLPTHEQVGK